ncbi:MAG TPA: hypothetical protein PKG81_07060, partial [Candidatus Omnitrophota bacterium]|nr:hypothetical protein [Candidatus Omnitrophota bacterium]
VVTFNKRPMGVVGLFIEEQGKFNDVAAEAWGNVYTKLSTYFDNGSKNTKTSRSIVDDTRE